MHKDRPSKPRLIMFDLDGTVVDTMQAFADLAASVMAERHGHDWDDARASYLQTSGIPFCKQLEVIHPGHAHNAAAADEFERRKLDICRAAPVDRETRAALTRLRQRGLLLVLSSNTGQSVVDEFVEREGALFDLALGFDPAMGLAKGASHVQRATQMFAVDVGEVVFVGDSLKDCDLAVASRVDFIGRVGTFSREQFEQHRRGTPTIEAISELEEMW